MLALLSLARPGDDAIVSQESHAVWHETSRSAANARVQLTAVGAGACSRPRTSSPRSSPAAK
jgi:threonine aldolase